MFFSFEFILGFCWCLLLEESRVLWSRCRSRRFTERFGASYRQRKGQGDAQNTLSFMENDGLTKKRQESCFVVVKVYIQIFSQNFAAMMLDQLLPHWFPSFTAFTEASKSLVDSFQGEWHETTLIWCLQHILLIILYIYVHEFYR